MKKIFLTAVGIAMIVMILSISQTAIAQVVGEFKSITLVEGKPYEEINVPPINSNLFALPPNYIGNDRNDGYVRVNLGFEFEFNGEIFTQAWICVNGFITLSPPPNLPAPNPQALFLDANNYPTNVIAPYWGDHYLRNETDFFQQGFVPSSISYTTITETDDQGKPRKVFIVQWKDLNINYLLDGQPVKSSVGNFQLRLYESTDAFSRQGDIEFCYGTIGPKNRPDITDTRVITRGAVVGVKGEGKIIGEGADYLNALFIDDLVKAATREDRTTDWQPSGGSDKRILLSATTRFNVAEWWGDGDVDFSKAIGRKHYNLPQNRFVTANDVRLILKSVAEGIPLDPVRRRAAYHADVNHNGRYYYNGAGQKVRIPKRSKVFTDDLPNEISSVKQILFEANEYDAAWIMKYISGRITELPWLIDTFVIYGKLQTDEIANGLKIGKISKFADNIYDIPVYLNNYLNGPLGIKFEINGDIIDIVSYETENNSMMVMNHNNRVVISGSGEFLPSNPVVVIKAKLSDELIKLADVRFNDNEIGDINYSISSVETNDLTNTIISNTPNPIVEKTIITLNINTEDIYNLNVYDMKGNLVKNLINNTKLNSGLHTIEWNLLDNNTTKVNSGVYFLRLESNGNNIIHKLIVEN